MSADPDGGCAITKLVSEAILEIVLLIFPEKSNFGESWNFGEPMEHVAMQYLSHLGGDSGI